MKTIFLIAITLAVVFAKPLPTTIDDGMQEDKQVSKLTMTSSSSKPTISSMGDISTMTDDEMEKMLQRKI
jgi:hypothetical protein